MTKKLDVGIKLTQPEIAAEMHDWANKNKLVMLVWTPEDVKELLHDPEMTTEDAQQILIAAEEDIHEFHWDSAKRYFAIKKEDRNG